jgi:hypothetical protein
MTTPPPDTTSASDHELIELPTPRRPWRRATLVTLSLAGLGSLLLALAVLPDVAYSLRGGQPRELGDLTTTRVSRELSDTWVHAQAQLSVTNAIRYRRPLERDSYRLASVEGNPKMWVQIRVPAGAEDPRFVPPDSFVGRLLPIDELGLRQRGLPLPSDDAWLLVDGESPDAVRWAFGLLALLVAFATFNVIGLVRLARPIPTAAGRSP